MITIPTINQIRDQIIADIESKIGQTIPELPKAFFRVMATALAGVLSLLYRFGAWAYDQIFPQTADDEALNRIGEQYGIPRSPSTAWDGTATATGASDTIIPAGTLWQFDGIVYQQTASVAIVAGVAIIEIESLTTGEDTNRTNGDVISLVTPQSGVIDEATIASTVTSGADAETTDEYRDQIMQRQRQKPQGGAVPDYIAWCLEVPGIVRSSVYRTNTGEVTVWPLLDTTGPNRVPDAGKLAEVDAYIEDEVRKPMCVNVVANPANERIFDVVVTGITPDTADIRTAVESAWNAYLYSRYPKQYADDNAPVNVISLAGLYAEAIGAGALGIVATMEIDIVGPLTQHTLEINEIAALGSITWPV